MQWKVLSSSTKAWSWDSWTLSMKTKNDVAFLTGSILITNSLNINISNKNRLCSTVDLFSVVRVILFNIYKIYKRFHLFEGGFEVLKLQYFKLLSQRHIQNLLKHLRWSFLLKSILFSCQIGFDIALTDVEATLKQRWDNVISSLKQRWNDVVQLWKTVASTLCNVDSTLFQRSAPTLYQCCATMKIRFRILFHFQRRINLTSTVIHNVETTLIWRWNVGWIVSVKKLILRNILFATLLTK